MKNQNKSIGVALKVFHKKSDLQNYEGTYYLHKKGTIYPKTHKHVESVNEAKQRLANVYGLDVSEIEAYITKDNIHLYYEFMSDGDLKKYANILKPIFQDRWSKLNQVFGGQTITAETLFNDNTMLPDSVFGAKDTLKPIDEYIAEIKASKEYQAYISSKLA